MGGGDVDRLFSTEQTYVSWLCFAALSSLPGRDFLQGHYHRRLRLIRRPTSDVCRPYRAWQRLLARNEISIPRWRGSVNEARPRYHLGNGGRIWDNSSAVARGRSAATEASTETAEAQYLKKVQTGKRLAEIAGQSHAPDLTQGRDRGRMSQVRGRGVGGLTYRPVKPKIAGSSPVGPA